MRLCVVAYKFGTENEIGEHLGTYHYFIEKMRRLVQMGHKVTLVAPYISWTKKGSTDVSGVKVIRYSPPLIPAWRFYPLGRIVRRWYILQTQKTVLKLVKERKFDFLYVWQARETGYAIARIKHKLGTPFYFRQITAWKWHFQRTPEEIFGKRGWYEKCRRLGLKKLLDFLLVHLLDTKSQIQYAKTIYEKADKIIFLSKAAIQESKALGLEEKKACDLGVAIEDDIFYPMNRGRELRESLGIRGEKVILFVGRINFSEKGVGVLLQAMKLVKEKMNDINLAIIGGGGEEDRMKKLVRDLKIDDCVQFLGKKPFSELPQYINAADVFAVPSIWMEAFGQVTIIAMSCGVPVVTSDAGASPEINIHGETGFVVPARDSLKLAEALIRILQDEPLRKKLGENARRRVIENYSYRAIINKFLRIVTP